MSRHGEWIARRYAILHGRELEYIRIDPTAPDYNEKFSKWALGLQTADRMVKETIRGKVRVSTVFLGKNMSMGYLPDMWFETLVMGGPFDMEIWRYSTYDEAEQGHEDACALVFNFWKAWGRTINSCLSSTLSRLSTLIRKR